MSATETAMRSSRQPRERRKPVFVARAKVGTGWQTLGAAWERRNGEPGYSVKLNTVPVGQWEGQFVLIPPLGDENLPEQPEE